MLVLIIMMILSNACRHQVWEAGSGEGLSIPLQTQELAMLVIGCHHLCHHRDHRDHHHHHQHHHVMNINKKMIR